jgi:hypothetical protein
MTSTNIMTTNPRSDRLLDRIAELGAAILFSSLVFELFPRVGWADAAVYTGISLNPDSFSTVTYQRDLYAEVSYHFGRMGFVGPLTILVNVAGPLLGRLLHNYLLITCFTLAISSMLRHFLDNSRLVRIAAVLLALNPWTISAISFGGSDGPAIAYGMAFLATLLRIPSHTRTPLTSSFFAGSLFCLAFTAHPFVVLPSLMAAGLILEYTREAMGRRESRPKSFLLMLTLGFLGMLLGLQMLYIGFGGRGFFPIIWTQAFKIDESFFTSPFLDSNNFATLALLSLAITSLTCATFVMMNTAEPDRTPEYYHLKLAMIGFGLVPTSFLLLRIARPATAFTTSYSNQWVLLVLTALILFVSAVRIRGIRASRLAILIAFLAVPVIVANFGSNSPLKVFNHSTEDFYKSQVEFIRTVRSSSFGNRPRIIYAEKESHKPSYAIYYKGQKIKFGFLSSLAYSIPEAERLRHRWSVNPISIDADVHQATFVLLDKVTSDAFDGNTLTSVQKSAAPANSIVLTNCELIKPYDWCLKRVNQPQATIRGALYSDQPDHWWTTATGIEIVLSNDLPSLELTLLSPFGKYAKVHSVRVAVWQQNQVLKQNFKISVQPFTGSPIRISDLSADDVIQIRSLSPCVSPFELDAQQFPDRRRLCVGISMPIINGQVMSLASAFR